MTSYLDKSNAVRKGLINVAGNASPIIRNVLCACAELDAVMLSEIYDAVETDVKLRLAAKADTAKLIAETDWTSEKTFKSVGKRIEAIKSIREKIPGYGLKEALELYDSWA